MTHDYIKSAKRVLDIERDAITHLAHYLDQGFEQACECMRQCRGKVVVCGMGKSGHIGNKIAATLASTGTPAFFMHPGEANHGDLGMLSAQDVLLTLSNSGETDELLALIPVIKRLQIPIIAMTGNANSTLAQHADIHICVKVEQEACSLGLAPTASTTATLVMGDALAIALLDANGFTPDDFALSHPGGSLGRKLLLRMADVMQSGAQMPLVDEQQTISNALLEISAKGLGMTGIVDADGRLQGIFTDGDLRRVLDAHIDVHTTPVADVMTRNGVTVSTDTLAVEVLNLMEQKRINSLFAIDDKGLPQGAVNMHLLLKAGVV
ncbi:KpsF/GutQ family sugar-phosphate isomerase [Aestuariibacter halophilus]|uniref:Arabinose 5-phosphate isomerase n=2 Tax=Fluctibacter halophilus TaxID=226011 RepID=A0ABS8GC77_9ALTE|nr:KpsF/GutQ family sugar-phosphate isomerase [Aestuariibacter halophilus]MCC2617846.1 KpsF/GutQ family sugar-phosphate isomerase [Aestuariibacter halophilus]